MSGAGHADETAPLPSGWTSATLGEVSTVSGGLQKSPKRAPREHTAPFLRVANVGSGVLDLDDVHQIELTPEELQRYRLEPGDLLVVEGNGSASQIGRAATWRGALDPCVHQNHLMRVRPTSAIMPEFLEYIWMSPAVSDDVRRRAASTSGLYVLTTKKISGVGLSLAPLPEQERIVAAIEEAFSKLDAGEAGLRTIRRLLKRMRASVLAAAVTGRLVPQDPTDTSAAKLLADLGTVAIERPDPMELPDGWAVTSLGAVSVLQEYGISLKAHVNPLKGDVPMLRMGNIQGGAIDPTDLKYVGSDKDGVARRLLERGDLLFNRTNSIELVGKSAVYRGTPARSTFASYLIRVRTAAGVEPEWCAAVINSQIGRRYIESVAVQQVGQANVNGTKLKALLLPLPPSGEQRRVLAELDRQFSFLDACERAVDAGLVRSAALRRSVLKAAFEGKLVPQDPRDEPASMLLKRIRAERAAAPKPALRARRTV